MAKSKLYKRLKDEMMLPKGTRVFIKEGRYDGSGVDGFIGYVRSEPERADSADKYNVHYLDLRWRGRRKAIPELHLDPIINVEASSFELGKFSRFTFRYELTPTGNSLAQCMRGEF